MLRVALEPKPPGPNPSNEQYLSKSDTYASQEQEQNFRKLLSRIKGKRECTRRQAYPGRVQARDLPLCQMSTQYQRSSSNYRAFPLFTATYAVLPYDYHATTRKTPPFLGAARTEHLHCPSLTKICLHQAKVRRSTENTPRRAGSFGASPPPP